MILPNFLHQHNTVDARNRETGERAAPLKPEVLCGNRPSKSASSCNCNCNCNLFAFRKSNVGYNPVDVDKVSILNLTL
jgi:hypothetical protein